MVKSFSVVVNKKIKNFNKEIFVDKDKSITHRVFFLASQAMGISKINGLVSDDINKTIAGLKKLGIKIIKKEKEFYVYGNGVGGFKKYDGLINCGNSGTSARFFLGILSTFPYPVTITGDKSLKKRPMLRVLKYLEKIGTNYIVKNKKKVTLPIKIYGTPLPMACKHELDIPSAQVKTAILLAALGTPGTTEIIEKDGTRDHTERLLFQLGAKIKIKKIKKKKIISLEGHNQYKGFNVKVPSDPSSARFFVVQTLLSKNSKLKIKNICINENRIGFVKILKKMNGKIFIINKKKNFGENIGDIIVKSSNLSGINCGAFIIPKLIDELPILFVAAALANGVSCFKGISELRFKESNRIEAMEKGLNSFGIKTKSTKNMLKIFGNPSLNVSRRIPIYPKLDHRIAMSFLVLGQVLDSQVKINNFETVNSSFPNFLKIQKMIGSKYEIKKKI